MAVINNLLHGDKLKRWRSQIATWELTTEIHNWVICRALVECKTSINSSPPFKPRRPIGWANRLHVRVISLKQKNLELLILKKKKKHPCSRYKNRHFIYTISTNCLRHLKMHQSVPENKIAFLLKHQKFLWFLDKIIYLKKLYRDIWRWVMINFYRFYS